MTELVLGTKKGLFVLEGEPSAASRSPRARSPASRSTTRCATRAPAGCSRPSGRRSTGRSSGTPMTRRRRVVPGSRVSRCPRAAMRRWSASGSIAPGEADGLLYAGGDPGVLFESRDGGATWELNEALWTDPSRADVAARAAAGCACTRSSPGPAIPSDCSWPSRPRASGSPRTAVRPGGGATAAWPPRYLPEEARDESIALCVHHVERSPAGPSGCSCSSTAACIAPTTRARAGPRSARRWSRTSAFRSPSTPTTPIPPTSSLCGPTSTG